LVKEAKSAEPASIRGPRPKIPERSIDHKGMI